MAQAPAKHDEPHPTPRKAEPDPLIMPLAEPGPGEPLAGATGVTGEHIVDGERDPHTIAEEQRIRSAAYEANLNPEAELEAARGGAQPQRRVAPPMEHQRQPPAHEQHHQASKK